VAAAWYLITRTLLTIGIADDLYRLVRGLTLLPFPILLTGWAVRLARTYRGLPVGDSVEEPQQARTGLTFALWKVWPVIAIAYIWATALFAITGFQEWLPYMTVATLETAAVVIGMLIARRGLAFLFTRAYGLNARAGQYLRGLEVRTLRYLQAIWHGTHVAIILIGIALILHIWGVSISWFFTSPVGSDILLRAIALVMTLAIVALIVDLSAFASQRLIEPGPNNREISKKRRTLIPLVCTVIKYGAMISGGLIVLHEVGINITPILAGVGIVSLAIGFGAQTLVKDIINGLFILFEDSIAVGDVAVIKGTGGLVEAVNLRTIRLRDLEGNVHIIPNSQVETITNMTKDFSYYALDVGVAYREDTDEVVAVLQEIDAGMREDPAFAPDMLAPIEILGVDRFADSAVIIKARLKTKPIRQWSVGREFNRRLKKAFDERGIQIPFPHQTIFWGEPKHGRAPAMQLSVQNLESVGAGTKPVELRITPPDGSQRETS
ncbi:MAG: mechanosensitive ion channel family protein, partial [Candidatus Entotheonellia bacterium]